jgi:tetratricopeptide (TPR) repeat protein
MPPGKIPVTFYLRFNLKNSLLAFGTGMLLGFICPESIMELVEPPPILWLGFGITSLLIYQFYAFSSFFGKRRGEFEYIYRQSLIDRRIKKVLHGLPFTFSDKRSVLNYAPTVAVPLLLKKVETESDLSRKFDIYMSMAWAAAKEDQHQQTIEYLQEAVTLKKDDLVANIRLGVSWERLGKGREAIQAYEMALQDPTIDSQPLKEFLSSQVDRVKTNGPQKGTPYRYLKYIWG